MTFPQGDLRFLRDMARDVIEAPRVKPNQRIGNSPPNALGHSFIRPGGRDCYPAVWVRDFVTSLDSKLISDEEARQHFELFARSQNGATERRLISGAIVPPHAIPDHPTLAKQVFADYIAHLRGNDFRRGAEFGGPWECFFKNGQHRQNASTCAPSPRRWASSNN